MGKLHNPERVVVHQGFFPATAEGVEDRFAFVSLDVDLHDPTAAGLEFFFPRLSPGGFIFVHDYNNGRYNGVRQAVEDFVARTPACTLSRTPARRGRPPTSARRSTSWAWNGSTTESGRWKTRSSWRDSRTTASR